MKVVRLRQRAREDLVAIGVEGREVWGEVAALRYVARLYDRLEMIAENPEIGMACDEVLKGTRRLREGSHVVYYLISDQGHVDVLRVLHTRMLPAVHLDD